MTRREAGDGTAKARWLRAASLEEVRNAKGCGHVVSLDGHVIALCRDGERVFAVDNRCPHMGFPLHRGTVNDGIITCHWHHARFDLESGGTFDLFADDVRAFPVDVRGDDVYVDVAPKHDPMKHQLARLRDGLERSISLVIGKAAIYLLDSGAQPVEPFRVGLDFGTSNRAAGWGSGLTMLTAMKNLLPALEPEDRPRAMFHGLSAVAGDTSGSPQRFPVRPLPTPDADLPTLKRWYRRFVEVRDDEGAERCIVTAVRAGADHRRMADMLFAAATDHRYIDTGHTLDFTNKAFEALDDAGWDRAEAVLPSLAGAYARASRREESNAWRNPVDLIALLGEAFDSLPGAVQAGHGRQWKGRSSLVPILLDDDPQAIVDALLDALRAGATETALAETVAYAAALRIARFHTRNEFGDWDTALHTFTFASAVHEGLRRLADVPTGQGYHDLLRGVFDAAMSVYLDRFLNIPAAKLPKPNGAKRAAQQQLADLAPMLDRQQQTNEAGAAVAAYLAAGGDDGKLLAALGRLLLREDRNFHTIQVIEASFRLYGHLRGTGEGLNVLVAAARYLAAHAPTMRSQGQTYDIALQLHRGENLFEDE